LQRRARQKSGAHSDREAAVVSHVKTRLSTLASLRLIRSQAIEDERRRASFLGILPAAPGEIASFRTAAVRGEA
jgi:hypothetical protein